MHFGVKMKHLLLLSVAALLLSGCKSTYSDRKVSQGTPPLLLSSTRVFIGMPFDASFKDKVAFGSGKKTAESLHAAFARNTKAIYIAKNPSSLSEALEAARRFKCEYLVYPSIVLWEDRATEWSGRRDKLRLRIDMIDLSTSEVVYAKEIDATGNWMTDGGETPGDLLDEPIESFVNALYRRTETPSFLR